jgi:hypothetical protein
MSAHVPVMQKVARIGIVVHEILARLFTNVSILLAAKVNQLLHEQSSMFDDVSTKNESHVAAMLDCALRVCYSD